jgi:quercetin dioxygenase-like cupin family protein
VVRVRFEPGARTAWHIHPFGQILYVLQGSARVQSAAGQIVEVQTGSSVRFGAGEDHWHGATEHDPMVHLAIQEANPDGVATIWGRHVTDDEYLGR